MTSFKLDDVKKIRDLTGAGMMDCKKSLEEVSGNFDEAVDWLRKKGISKASKKSSRVAAEGLVGICVNGKKGVLVEINSETDFVSRNSLFQDFVASVTKTALKVDGDIEVLKSTNFEGSSHDIATELTNMVAKIGENMNLRRASMLSVSTGIVGSYIHNATCENAGKIAVLVGLESSANQADLLPLAKQIAMHIAAANPEALSIEDIDPSSLEREKNVLMEQARASGKPEEIIEKMMHGRLRKYYEEIVLLEQLFVIDGETKISKVIENEAKKLGSPIKLVGYVSYKLGDGIEKEESDFAAEVAETLGK